MRKKKQQINIASPVVEEREEISDELDFALEKAGENAADSSVTENEIKTVSPIWTYLTALVFIVGFASFAALSRRTETLLLAAAGISSLFFAVLMLKLVPRLMGGSENAARMNYGERSRKHIHPVLGIIVMSLIAQAGVIVLSYVLCNAVNGMQATLPVMYERMFMHSSGRLFGENTASLVSSLGVISYFLPHELMSSGGSETFKLVLTGVNTLAIAAASVFSYELLIDDDGRRIARFSVTALHLLPSILVLLQPFSGTALFFAFASLCLLLARRGKFVWSGIAALISCLFNMFGLLLIVPIAVEGAIAVKSARAEQSSKNPLAGVIIGSILPLLALAAVCVLSYLGYKGVSAAELRPVFFFETLGRLLKEWDGVGMDRIIVLLSVCALVFVGILLFLCCNGRTRLSYTLYAVLAFALTPSLLGADLGIYAAFCSPALAALVATRCRWRPLRVVAFAVLTGILTLTIAFLFIARN